MTDQEQLLNIRALCLQQLQDLREEPKPTVNIGGDVTSWNDYYQSLQATVDWCDAKLLALEPVEVRSRAGT
jgi:hypothetical protein